MNSTPTLPGSTGRAAAPSLTISFAIGVADQVSQDGDSVMAGFNNAGASPDATYSCLVEFVTNVIAAFTGASVAPPVFTNVAAGGRTSTVTLANVATVIATKPYHIFIVSSVNDPLNSVSPTTTASNYTAYFAAVLLKSPGCRFHVISNIFGDVESWPSGSGSQDASIVAMNTAIQGAVALCPFATYYDVRTPIYAVDEPTLNPTNLATGVLVQGLGGDHPTKPLGQTTISNRVFNMVTLVT